MKTHLKAEFIFNSTLYMHAHTFVFNPARLRPHPFCEPKHLCARIQLIVLMSASLMLFLSCTRPIVTASNTKPGVTAG